MFGEAIALITDVETVDDEFLVAHRLTRADLAARGWAHMGWVEIAVRHCCEGDAFSQDDVLRDAYAFHMPVATNIAAHLQLVFENVMRTSWLAGAVLSPDAASAQRAARELHDKLIRTDAAARTTFEKAFVEDGRLEMLAAFADRPAPVVLWRGDGRYAALFRWLAVRFLGNPDHVLQCESVHAQWQWIEAIAHNIKMKQLNAQLLVRAWLQHHHDLPSHDELGPHINDVQEDARRRYAIVAAGGAVAAGHRAEHLYLERFNLTAADVVLLGARRHARGTETTATSAYRNYLMRVFSPGSFYSVVGLRPSLWFFVMQNKVLAGRDQEWADAMGRPLSVVYFEKDEGEADAPIVRRCDGDGTSLEPTAATLAELIRTMGYAAPVASDASVQETEDAFVNGWLAHEPLRWRHERAIGHADVWAHALGDPTPAERHYLQSTHPSEMTKMGCARYLELFEGANREDMWRRLDKEALEAAVGVPPEPAAVGRGRGRGRGRARRGGR